MEFKLPAQAQCTACFQQPASRGTADVSRSHCLSEFAAADHQLLANVMCQSQHCTLGQFKRKDGTRTQLQTYDRSTYFEAAQSLEPMQPSVKLAEHSGKHNRVRDFHA
eukprot:TRINITY_DN3887_c0_g1_i1.p2 TRINITY_DN3887_c0_g1~~TRINITY_DN3887_c0_g1_i1.p2  ORF type:complete len:108 (-),score=6.17 TRINITY_DN3887_c0_g1_i1:768-1091(-)